MAKFITNGGGVFPKGIIFSGKKEGDKIIIDWTKKMTKDGVEQDLSMYNIGGVLTTISSKNADRYFSVGCKVGIGIAVLGLVGVFYFMYKKMKK